ncbi:MAG: IS1634 family transposase [Candidatus Acidifodinimicrobium sp.]
MSFIARRKVGDRVYLEERESYRENGKVKSRFLRYLGTEGPTKGKPITPQHILDRIQPSSSYRAGDVGLLWELAKDLNMPQTIDKFCPHRFTTHNATPGILLTTWAINRLIYPESATQLESWVPTTDIPRLTGVSPDAFTKDSFLYALDKVCGEDPDTGSLVDRCSNIDGELYRYWRETHPLPKGERNTLAYDITSMIFFGVTCPLAELGYNAKNIQDQLQVNLGILVSRYDHMPVCHSVYEGSRHGVTTVRNLLTRLSQLCSTQKGESIDGTLIWDRGMVSADHVKAVEAMGWQLVCGLPKTVKAVQDVLDATEVPARPETLVRHTKTNTIYAVDVEAELYGKRRRVVVYLNRARGVKEADQRNDALADTTEKLKNLSIIGEGWTEAKLHKVIDGIVGRWAPYIEVQVRRKGNEYEVDWRYHQHMLRAAERLDGKWALLVTDPRISVVEAVNMYLEKDFIEKSFRIMKTEEEMEPVRHRMERRVRAYEFVQVLALRLRTALRWLIKEVALKEGMNPWESEEELLKVLGRVERVEVTLGKESRIWHLNLLKSTRDVLGKIGYGDLFSEEPIAIASKKDNKKDR